MKINDVYKELKIWGEYWAIKELGQGSASVSVTKRCCDILKTGIFSNGTAIQVSHLSENIYVPEHIQNVDNAIKKLTINERIHIQRKYKMFKEIDNLYTRRAELKITNYL